MGQGLRYINRCYCFHVLVSTMIMRSTTMSALYPQSIFTCSYMTGIGFSVSTYKPFFVSLYARHCLYTFSNRPGPTVLCIRNASSRIILIISSSFICYSGIFLLQQFWSTKDTKNHKEHDVVFEPSLSCIKQLFFREK
jgi:hypothetical protein